MKKSHGLAITPQYLTDILENNKRFELRRDDRGYEVGDLVLLKEFKDGYFTGRYLSAEIVYILRHCPEYGLHKDYCILGLDKWGCR